jgi:hypothetical protein
MSNYGVSLLDDIDSHLPELLYNQSRFRTIGDVLDYVYEAAIETNEEYYLTRMQEHQRESRGSEEINLDVLRQAGELVVEEEEDAETESDTEEEADESTSDVVSQVLLRFRNEIEDNEENDRPRQRPRLEIRTGAQPSFLQSLLIIPPPANQANRARVEATLREFFEPVPIVPTQEQIASSSVLYNSIDDSEEARCSICQDDIRFGEEVRSLTHCDHFFHRSCIDLWLQSSVRCPLCRHDIRESSSE